MSEQQGVALTRRGVLAGGVLLGVGSSVLASGLARAAAAATNNPPTDLTQLERTRVELVAPPRYMPTASARLANRGSSSSAWRSRRKNWRSTARGPTSMP